MAYIGNTPQYQSFAPAVDYFSGNGVTVTFTLSRPVASVAQLTAVIDNVIQNPSSAFTVAGNQITFTSAPLSGTNNIWVEYTSLITTYQGISQDPSVIGDITATGGYLSTGDFGNSFIDGTLIDYVTGAGRFTVGELDDLVFYHGGTSGRSEMMRLSYAGTNSYVAGNLGLGTTTNPTAVTGFATPTRTVLQASVNGYGQLRLGGVSGTMLDHDDSGNTITTLRSLYGATSASAQMQLQSGFITFGTGTSYTERMRIDSSGNVGIGNTGSTSFKFNVTGTGTSSAAYALRAEDSGTNNLFSARNDGFITTGTRGVSPYNNTTSNSANMYVDSIGGLYRSTSSLKYKTDVQNATHGLEDLLKLRSVTYKQKNADADGNPVNTVFGGLIAEEVDAAGLTEFVQYAEDGTPDALAYGNMVSLCIKAIQEQQAIITSLTARIAALEAK
jgi:hypothetical protein